VVVETCLVRSDLFGSVLVCWKLYGPTNKLVNGPDDLEHLVVGDCPIAVDVIDLEQPWRIMGPKVRQHQGGGAGIVRWLSFEANHGEPRHGEPRGENRWEQGIRTLKLLIRTPSQSEGEGVDEFLETNPAVVVGVNGLKEYLHEFARFTVGEEPSVELRELVPVEPTVRVVSEEPVVPVCVCVCVCGVGGSGERERERETYEYDKYEG